MCARGGFAFLLAEMKKKRVSAHKRRRVLPWPSEEVLHDFCDVMTSLMQTSRA